MLLHPAPHPHPQPIFLPFPKLSDIPHHHCLRRGRFVVQVCRGQIQEGLKGTKRCVGLNDTELQVGGVAALALLDASGALAT